MKLRYLTIALLLLFLPYANAALEKPNWSVGDYWKYSGSYSVSESIDYENYSFSIDISTQSVNILLKVVDVEVLEIDDKAVGCYKTAMNASISGTLHIEGNLFGKDQTIDGTFTIEATGTIYFTTKNLSVVSNENDVYINVSTTVPIPNLPVGKATIKAEYNPPLDFMNFPVNEGEKWEANSYATLYYGDYPTSGEVSFSFECTKVDGDVYIIKSGYNPFGDIIPFNNTYMFWNAKKGMIERLIDTGGSQSLMIQLVDWRHEEKENIPPVARIKYSPEQPKVGSNIFFESDSTDEDGTIVSWHWDFGDGTTSNQQNPTHKYTKAGEYTVTLTVMDNYGEEDTTSIKITVESSGGGGGTPGFEVIFAIAAVIFIAIRRRIR